MSKHGFVYAFADRFCMFAFEERIKVSCIGTQYIVGGCFVCRLRKQQQLQWENKHLSIYTNREATCCAVAIIYNVNIL